jgi:G3E family GTPase
MRLPVSILSGYLGAGKTTLINRLLAEDHRLNLMVVVNDFGAVNIDDALIREADGDTIALTNGCACCSVGADLEMALRRILVQPERPDHLVIEASGVADPAALANTVTNIPELSYGGIVTLVDALNASDLLDDDLLAPQVLQQIKAADMVCLSKSQGQDEALLAELQEAGVRAPLVLGEEPVADLLFDVLPLPRTRAAAPHPAYASWQHSSREPVDRRALGDKLAARPAGMYRMKGFVLTSGGAYRLHVVGQHVEAKRCEAEETQLVALGPADRVSREEIEAWWQG